MFVSALEEVDLWVMQVWIIISIGFPVFLSQMATPVILFISNKKIRRQQLLYNLKESDVKVLQCSNILEVSNILQKCMSSRFNKQK